MSHLQHQRALTLPNRRHIRPPTPHGANDLVRGRRMPRHNSRRKENQNPYPPRTAPHPKIMSFGFSCRFASFYLSLVLQWSKKKSTFSSMSINILYSSFSPVGTAEVVTGNKISSQHRWGKRTFWIQQSEAQCTRARQRCNPDIHRRYESSGHLIPQMRQGTPVEL